MVPAKPTAWYSQRCENIVWGQRPAKLAASVVGLAIAAGVATALLVAQGAGHIAGALPYCIQVADGEADYKPARTLFDLSGLRMWARRESSMFMRHHAILVVGDETSPRLFSLVISQSRIRRWRDQ
jgi:ABC-type cobalamin transport system permease subunit